MQKVKILFPQIAFESKEVEVSEQIFDAVKDGEIRLADFIWDNLSDDEKTHTTGLRMINLLVDFCKVTT